VCFSSALAGAAAAVGTAGRDVMTRVRTSYRGDILDAWSSYTSIGLRFRDEMGFVPRVNISKADFHVATHIRPRATSSWLRDFWPHYEISNVRLAESGAFDSRFIDYHVPLNFQNGSMLEPGVNANTEVLTVPFTINSRRNITIDPGRYDYKEWFVLFNGNRSAPVSFTGRYSVGHFYDGYKHNYSAGILLRTTARLNTSVNLSRNAISLLRGAYTTDLVTARVNYSFSTRMFVNALLQYNTDAQQWSSNIRFNIIHRPLSDFFLVYNDRRGSTDGALPDRALVAKVTYMLAF
jgi:hypothetical protein